MRFGTRVAVVLIAALVLMFAPVDWADTVDSIQWGTVPEWVGAGAIVALAVGVWRVAHHLEQHGGVTPRSRQSNRVEDA